MPVYVMANGILEDPARFKDSLRVYYLYNYINKALKAYTLDGVNLKGYFAYALNDQRDPGCTATSRTSPSSRPRCPTTATSSSTTASQRRGPRPSSAPASPHPAWAAKSSPRGPWWASSLWWALECCSHWGSLSTTQPRDTNPIINT
ncbi:lactase/phlorizin hydrolase-like [Osmerus eperlanus]|uniref:lactase/phlorizin hydrolase-like n=1 Tax=Osmerus eperlanus TaxID=29151 RepID=UPI002E0E7D7B